MASADELRRRREDESAFAFLYDMARERDAQLAAEGRRPFLGGLLSVGNFGAGADKMDVLRDIDFEGVGSGLLGLLSPVARAADAPISAYRGTIPQEDMLNEAMNVTGMAMAGGGAIASPQGALAANALRSDFVEPGKQFMRPMPDPDNDRFAPSDIVMAQRILDMRADGRASEVTDEMMAQADPQHMFKNTPLPMDEASRMARAGNYWPSVGYHSTRNDFLEFDRGDIGYHIGTEEQATERLKDTRRVFGSDGEAILPLSYRAKNPLQTVDAGQWDDARRAGQAISRGGLRGAGEIREDAVAIAEDFYDNDDWIASSENVGLLGELRSSLENDGYDSVRYWNEAENAYGGNTPGMTREAKARYNMLNREYHELRKAEAQRAAAENPAPDPSTATDADIDAWLSRKIEPVDSPVADRMHELREQMDYLQETGLNDGHSVIVLDPANIRSRFARFDPEFAHLANLNAANASTVGGLLAQSGVSDKQAEKIETYLKKVGLLQ
jgi:hypothetical protein